ncbi:MAG: hypothetical protein KAY32_08415 [Candidatus Eisenbacteria sp.]|nr:hypothetical protein [Candidatus Eisenbacteria bacterium]
MAAARDGLLEFLRAVPMNELEYFGFHDQDELSRATLGEPFRVYTMLPSEILAVAGGEPTAATIHSTTLWQFPVLCDGTSRTLLTIDDMDGIWAAVDLGGLSPAIEMRELADRWPRSQGYELEYVRVFQTGSQFISVTKDNLSHLVSLESTARSLGMLAEGEAFEYQLMDVSAVVAILAPFVWANLETTQE